MRHILLIALMASVSCGAYYFAVTPDSHLVVLNSARDTVWKSSDVVAAGDSSWLTAATTDSLDAGGLLKADSGAFSAGVSAARFRGALTGTADTAVKVRGDSVGKAGLARAYTPLAPDSTVALRADGVAARPVGIFYETDFLALNGVPHLPWTVAGRNAGGYAISTGSAVHPGILRTSSSTSANSGAYTVTGGITLLLAGGEVTDIMFRPETLIGSTIRLGILDAVDVNVPVDGVYFDVLDTLLTGKTASNTTKDTTVTSYRVVANTWYWGNIALNANATLATFTLRNGTTGAVLWTDTLSAGIPTSTGRETGHGVVATNANTTAYPLVDVDYMNLWIRRQIGPPGLR
jgi:hypothetical protein